jgi:hypothetical protein
MKAYSLKRTVFLVMCLIVFTLLLFGQYRRDLTRELRDAIGNNDVRTTESLLKDVTNKDGGLICLEKAPYFL